MLDQNQTAQPDEKVAEFWDDMYARFDPSVPVEGALNLPAGAPRLEGKSVLIVACGTGYEVVRACREAASVTAIDISAKAVENAKAMVEHNGLHANYAVGDAGRSGLPSESFDVIWGSAVLHHLQHEEVAVEFARILKPGGVIYMMDEPTFFNPLLKFGYETAFGKGRVGRRRKFLGLTRYGDDFEKPIDHDDLEPWKKSFEIEKFSNGFMFFNKLGRVLSRNASVPKIFNWSDRAAVAVMPFLKRWGYEHDFTFRKKSQA